MGITYNIAPKPTYYDGFKFRSRLEATWAALFDLLKWRWEYEPLDLKGWVPDFVLHGVEPIAVEVKPVMRFEDFPQDGFDKMNSSGWEGRILIVGTGLVEMGMMSSIGWMADNRLPVEGPRVEWLPCRLVQFDSNNDQVDIATTTEQQGYLFNGNTITARQSPVIMRRLWALASNKTAWRR
jgi:hypothetical protein